jgi:hypothetical protein
MKTTRIAAMFALVLGAALVSAGAAAAQTVATNYDTKVDFSKYKTYHWVDITGATYPNQLNDMMIRSAVDSTLKMKGLVRQDSGSVDLYVGYQLTTQEQKQLNTYNTGGGAWGYGGGWGGMGGMSTTTVQNLTEGTLAVDLYDPAMKQLVWQSTGTKTLNPSSNAAKNQANTQKATNKMFKNYPPAPAKPK